MGHAVPVPLIINLIRRWLFARLVLPIAGKVLHGVSARLRSSRGDSRLASALDTAGDFASRRSHRHH